MSPSENSDALGEEAEWAVARMDATWSPGVLVGCNANWTGWAGSSLGATKPHVRAVAAHYCATEPREVLPVRWHSYLWQLQSSMAAGQNCFEAARTEALRTLPLVLSRTARNWSDESTRLRGSLPEANQPTLRAWQDLR